MIKVLQNALLIFIAKMTIMQIIMTAEYGDEKQLRTVNAFSKATADAIKAMGKKAYEFSSGLGKMDPTGTSETYQRMKFFIANNKGVLVFTKQPECSQCTAMKKLFTDKKVKFIEKKITPSTEEEKIL